MQLYEAILALDPKLSQEEREKIQAKLEKKINEAGGQISQTNLWGLRPFAFRPQRFKSATKGFFVHMELQGNSSVPEELKNTIRVTEGIVRFLITRAPAAPPPSLRTSQPPHITTTAAAAPQDVDTSTHG